MCPDADKAAFEDIEKHQFFNTNNLWVNLEALQKTMADSGGMLPLPLIKNKKTVNPRDSSSTPVRPSPPLHLPHSLAGGHVVERHLSINRHRSHVYRPPLWL